MIRLFTTHPVHKVLLVSFILLFSFLSYAQEGERDIRYGGYARLHAMGDNPYIVDPSNMKLNPAYSSIYTDFIWGDIGSSTENPEDGYGQFAGFNYGFNKKFTLGFLLTRNDFMPNNSIGSLDPRGLVNQINNRPTGAPNIIPLDNNFELLGSYGFGKFVLGLGLAYAATTNDYKPAAGNGDKNSARQFGINLGIMGPVSSAFKFDAAISLILPSATYEPGGGGNKVEASNTDLLVDARGFWRLTKIVTLVPSVEFYNSTGTLKDAGQSTDLNSISRISVGIGFHYQVGDLLIAGGPYLQYRSETTPSDTISAERTDSYTRFPGWNLGFEWYITDWLIGRMGYVASTSSNTDQTAVPGSATTVNERNYTSFGRGDVRLGVGFRFGGFTLDATINDQVLREGFNLIGGGTPSFAYLSGTYAF